MTAKATFAVIGVDLSLRSTGIATAAGDTATLVPPATAARGIPRLRWVRDAILERGREARVLALEGYAFSAHASHAHELGELGGVVRVGLAEASIPYVDVPPATLKLFACGRGNAPKEEMLAAAIRRLGYAGHSHDIADALWLCHMATVRYTATDLLAALTQKQQQALVSVPWPALDGARPGALALEGIRAGAAPKNNRPGVAAEAIREP